MAVEYEKLVYLDPQKTGSTFVEEVLLEVFGREPSYRGRHEPLKVRDSKRLHCISVRDPWDQYMSLYRYGRDRRGGVYLNLKGAGLASSYETFGSWLDVVLDPEHAPAVAPMWGKTGVAPLFGLQTFRYLRMAIPRSLDEMTRMRSTEDVRAVHDEKKAWDVVLRTESLSQDLATMLIQNRRRLGIWKTRGSIERIVASHAGANASKSKRQAMDPRDRDRIAEREWLLLEQFGY